MSQIPLHDIVSPVVSIVLYLVLREDVIYVLKYTVQMSCGDIDRFLDLNNMGRHSFEAFLGTGYLHFFPWVSGDCQKAECAECSQ